MRAIGTAWAVVILLGVVSCGVLAQEPASARGKADFYVAVAGNDGNPGTEAQPFAALTRARDAVRELRKVQPDRDVLVLIRGGIYRMDRPIVFAGEDSGREGGAVTYAAYPGEKPIISGGRVVTGLQPGKDGIWEARIPEVRDGKWFFEQLFVNGRRAVRARTPNGFYFYMAGTRTSGMDPATGKPGKLDDHAFIAYPKDIAPLVAMPPGKLREVVVAAYHSWEISRHHVAAVASEMNMVFLTGRYPPLFYHYTQNERYYLENFREALDAPGEWFLDRDGILYYKPLPGEDMATAEVVAPVTDTLVCFRGTGDGKPVANITVRGLGFVHGQYLLPAEGQYSPQAACEIAAVIMADYARNVTLQDCTVEHTGTYGVWFRDGCRDCSLERCFLNDLGAGGVRLGQTSRHPNPSDLTSHIRVDNNIIRNGGHIWPDAVGVLIGLSGDNQVTHNDIAGLPYTGISAGWQWGYGKVASVRNTITFNHIHHLGWDVLADMGGVYTLGETPGTTVSNNLIHDIDGDGDSGMQGLYNDNSTSYILMENNLVYSARDGGYHLGSGKGNILRNNIFVAGKTGQFRFSLYYDKETHVAATLEKNIVYGSGGDLFRRQEGTIRDRIHFKSNLYWEPSGTPMDFAGLTFADWQKKGRDEGSVIADPKFVDPANGDFHLKPDSPALALGFVPFDYTQAGVYGAPEWVSKAKEVHYSPWEHMPPGPPLTFFDDFEATPAGDAPAFAACHVEKKGDAIAVTEETAAGGKRSLKITDAPGLKYAFNPHFFFSPRLNQGVATLSFDIRIEKGAQMYCEWREYPGNPYFYVGPRIAIRNEALSACDKDLLSVPGGQWLHVEMSAGQGNRADGTWQLTVVLPGEGPKRFNNLKTGNPEARKTTWLGFVSDGSQKAVYYLDNIRLSSSGE